MTKLLLTAAAVVGLAFATNTASAARTPADSHKGHRPDVASRAAPSPDQLAGGYSYRSYRGHPGYYGRSYHRPSYGHHYYRGRVPYYGHGYHGYRSYNHYRGGYGRYYAPRSGVGVNGRNFSLYFGF